VRSLENLIRLTWTLSSQRNEVRDQLDIHFQCLFEHRDAMRVLTETMNALDYALIETPDTCEDYISESSTRSPMDDRLR